MQRVSVRNGDVANPCELASLLKGHDAAVSSVRFGDSDPRKLIAAARESKVGRYLVGGQAGSQEVAPGVRLVSTPGFPDIYKPEAEKGAVFLDVL